MSQDMIICSRPECQTSAGCQCNRFNFGYSYPPYGPRYEPFETGVIRRLDDILRILRTPQLNPLPMPKVQRNCLYCGAVFEVGVGTGRRADAKYCTDTHRTLFHSRQRSIKNPSPRDDQGRGA